MPQTPSRRLALSTCLAAALAASALAGPAAADVLMYDRPPSVEELADLLLAPQPEAQTAMKTRGIRMKQEIAARPAPAPTPVAAVPQEAPPPATVQVASVEPVAMPQPQGTGVGFNIAFAFDSTEILPESRPYLDNVAAMMNMERAFGATLLIAGHTDATGDAGYNQTLSERRAAAAKAYLVREHGVDPQLLATVGYGESQLIDPQNPNGGINRRVEFYRTDG